MSTVHPLFDDIIRGHASNLPERFEESDDLIKDQTRFDDFTDDEYLIEERPYTEPEE